MQNKKKKINGSMKSWLFENIGKTNKLLARPTKKKDKNK